MCVSFSIWLIFLARLRTSRSAVTRSKWSGWLGSVCFSRVCIQQGKAKIKIKRAADCRKDQNKGMTIRIDWFKVCWECSPS
jgi:hypothetical protein